MNYSLTVLCDVGVIPRAIAMEKQGIVHNYQHLLTCAQNLKCPLCPAQKTGKFSSVNEVERHLESHWKTRVMINSECIMYVIVCRVRANFSVAVYSLRCHLQCRGDSHFHCPNCAETIIRKCDVLPHFSKKHTAAEELPRSENHGSCICAICGSTLLSKNLSRHMDTQHNIIDGECKSCCLGL